MKTQLIDYATSRCDMDGFIFDLGCLWHLRRKKSTWNPIQKDIARQIRAGEKLGCQGSQARFTLEEFGQIIQHEQRGYAFGTHMSKWMWMIEGARRGFAQL